MYLVATYVRKFKSTGHSKEYGHILKNKPLQNYAQWRRQDFGSGEKKASKGLPPASGRGRGAGSPVMVTKIKILKRFKVESILKNINIFLARKIHFSKKNYEKLSIFTKIFRAFLNLIENFQFLRSDPINPEKFLMNSIIY